MTNAIAPDFVLESPRGRRHVVVEVHGWSLRAEADAQFFRRAMIEHGMLEGAGFFLLVSPEVGFLWANATSDPDAPPVAVFSMAEVIARYWPEPASSANLFGAALDMIIQQWLYDLTNIQQRPEQEPERTLYDAGMIEGLWDSVVVAGDAL